MINSKKMVSSDNNLQETISLRKKLVGLDEGLTVYNHLDKDEEDILIPFAMSLFITSAKIRQLARVYNDDLDRGECWEMLGNNLYEMSNAAFWLEKCAKLKHDMLAMSTCTMKEQGYDCTVMGFKPKTTADFYRAIEDNLMALTELLSETCRKLSDAPLSLYGHYYRHLRKQYNDHQVQNDYKNKLSHLGIITADKLKSLRALLIADFINCGILKYAFEPSECERSKVDIESFKSQLPHTFEFKESFDDRLAIFYRTVRQEGDFLMPDYDCAGLFIFQHYDDLTQTDIQAIFYLDQMLELIHDELMQLQPLQTDDDASKLHDETGNIPLSALFREKSHQDLRQKIESWRPYLIDDDRDVDPLSMTCFTFDKKQIYSNRVYYDLLDLEADGALLVSLSQLASYLAIHTNLSSTYTTLYRQLKKYRQERLSQS